MIEKPSEIDVFKDNLNVSVLSRQGEISSSVTPYQQRIPCKNKRNKTPDTSIIRKEHIQEPLNPSKRTKEISLTDVEKLVLKKHLHCFGIR